MKLLKVTSAALAISFIVLASPLAHSAPQTTADVRCAVPVTNIEQIRIIGASPQSPEAQSLLTTFNDLVRASNEHNIEDILNHYNPQFISGDNLNLTQIKSLIQETWESYPDICYVSQPIEIRVNGDWATIETYDRSQATAPPDKEIMNVPGKLTSESRSLLFLRKTGAVWEITSDSTIWEEAIIRYGIGDDVDIVLSAPEQVKAGESYSATIQAKVPEGAFTIATIDNQPLTYPHEKTDDKFRPLGGEENSLQRVMKANTSNHNEIVTATLGLTSLDQKNPERPSLSLNGIATVVKRVNVVPISAEDVLEEMKKKDLVRTSANGVIDLNAISAPAMEDDATSGPELELTPSEDNVPPPVENEEGE